MPMLMFHWTWHVLLGVCCSCISSSRLAVRPAMQALKPHCRTMSECPTHSLHAAMLVNRAAYSMLHGTALRVAGVEEC